MKLLIEKLNFLVWFFAFCYSVQAQTKQTENHLTICVADKDGSYVTNLMSENMQVLIDGKPQKITSLSVNNDPSTIVFLLDLSESQEKMTGPTVKAAKEIVENANPNSEYVVIAFNSKVQLVLDKSQNAKAVEEAISKPLNQKAKGETAFYDAMYLAIEKADSGKYEKKIIINLGDGIDNNSRSYDSKDISKSLKQSTVLFYSLGYSISPDTPNTMMSQSFLENFSGISGGKSFFPVSAIEFVNALKTIILELKSQYRVEFTASDVTKSNKWQDVKIKLEPSVIKDNNKKREFSARTRSGIYLSR